MESEAAVYRDKCNNGEIHSNLSHQKMQTERGQLPEASEQISRDVPEEMALQKSQSPTLPELQGQKSANYAKLVSPSRELLVLVVSTSPIFWCCIGASEACHACSYTL